MPLTKPTASLEAHFIQINLFPCLRPQSAIRAERAVGFGIRCRCKEMYLAELPSLAGEGNRTLVSSLEGYSFTIKLHPHESRPSWRACAFLPSAFSRPSRLANRCRRHYHSSMK